MAAFGAPPELLKQAKADELYEVFEEHWDALKIFLKMLTQWKVSQGAFIGLNYQSLEFLFDLYKVKDKAATLENIQTMEMWALKILNERK